MLKKASTLDQALVNLKVLIVMGHGYQSPVERRAQAEKAWESLRPRKARKVRIPHGQ